MPIALVLTLTSIFFVAMKGNRVLVNLFAVDLGAGPFQTGLLFALHGILPFLFAVSAGRVADRFDNRVLMYIGLTTYGVAMLFPFLWPGLPALYLSAAFAGFTSMLFVLATQNYVGVMASAENRTKYFSYYALGEGIAMRLAVSYGAHVFIPTMFGALGAAIGLSPIFWWCARALMSGSVMNARHTDDNT